MQNQLKLMFEHKEEASRSFAKELERLREIEARYLDIMENAKDIIYIHDLAGRYTFLNKAGERLIGYSSKEALNMSLADVAAPEQFDRMRRRIQEKLAGAEQSNYEAAIVTKDGRILTLETSSWLIYKNGVPVGVQGIARDVSARKHAEEQLYESEERYRVVAETATDVIITIDEKNTILFVNKSVERVFGYAPAELIGKSITILMPERARGAHSSAFNHYLSTRNKTIDWGAVELPGLNKKGQIVPLEISFGEFVKNGKRFFTGIARDISERKRADEALRFQKTLLESQSETSLDGILVVDRNGKIISYNNRFVEMWGISAEIIASRSDEEALHFVERKLVNPEEFLKTVEFLYQHPNLTSRDEVTLKDGQIFDRYSAPIKNAENTYYGRVWYFRDITERKRIENKLLYNAFHDSLTGLANRALLMDHLRKTIERCQTNQESKFAVLFLDFDRFKLINDSLGHAEGDGLLKLIAGRLAVSVRPNDLVARLGGDEFIILLNDLRHEADAVQIVDRIQNNLKQPFNLNGIEIFISASVGIALGGADCHSAENMVRDADIAMYQAKARGKSRYQVFNRAMHEHATRQLKLETEMRHALERKEFELRYQPIIELKTRALVGFEVLVRWNHPERGLLTPFEFIPAAEENNLILLLGQWVLQESCRQLREWQNEKAVAANLKISVNLSSKQFLQTDLAEQIADTLHLNSLDPNCLKLEITESHIMDNSETAITIINRLRALGLELSLDDFGTGYSSLSYLHRLPVSYLKIDRSFISGMIKSKVNSEIVHTVIKLAQNLKMKVVAEGIETEKQLSRLLQLNCEYGQGYLFAKPLNSEEARMYIETRSFANTR